MQRRRGVDRAPPRGTGLDQPPAQRPRSADVRSTAAAACGRDQAGHLQPDAPDFARGDLALPEQLQGVRLKDGRVGGGMPEV